MYCIVLLVILSASSPVYGIDTPGDSRSQGLACAGVMLADDATVMPNQAALAILRKVCFSIYGENAFLIPGLTSGAIFLCIPSKSGTFGFSLSGYGNNAYRESKTGLAFGKAIGDKFRAGIEMSYWAIHQSDGYGNLHAFIPSLGAQVIPTNHLTLGFQVTNPAGQSYYPKGYSKIPVLLRAGIGYSPGSEILICFEYQKETQCRPVYCGGVEYNCGRMVTLSIGLSSSRLVQYSFGLGIRKDHLRTHLAVIHHAFMGYCPSITLSYIF